MIFTAILGLLSGILAGLAVGGGTLLVPGLVLLRGVDQHVAQGISLFIFLPTSLLAIATHWRYGNIKLALAGRLVISSVIGAYLGSLMAMRLSAPQLRRIFAIYMIAMGIYQLIHDPKLDHEKHDSPPRS